MGYNIFMVKLNGKEGKEDAIAAGPWIINDTLFSIQKYNSGIKPGEHEFLV